MPFLDETFFHALQQEPTDDALRLVYSDYLEETGDEASLARAEFIRTQVVLATLPPKSPRTAELTARQDQLQAEWERVWLGEWADVLDGWTFHRGLIEAVQVDAARFLEHAADWFGQWPTLSVAKLTRAGGHLPELAACPWLAHLRGLDLANNSIDALALAHLMPSRFISLLQALNLSGNPIGSRGALHLANARWADDLTELHLSRCGLRGEGLENLLSGRARQWRRLDLSENNLYRRDLVALAESPELRHIASLNLAHNPIGSNGASLLAESANAVGLVELGLCGTSIGNTELTALARSSYLGSLRSLDLRLHNCWREIDHNREDQGGLAELARSPLLSRLRRLLLSHSRENNGWTADVLRFTLPPRYPTVEPGYWVADQLRKSRYLMPSQLTECDVEELWWLGDTRNRERLPSPWQED